MNALMTHYNLERAEPHCPQQWEGLSEIDQAIRENRLTEYRLKKAWLDPINRWVTLFVVLILLVFAAFVVVNDVIL